MLSLYLYLFALLHQHKDAGPHAARIAQDLADCFTADNEAVLRELRVGDLYVLKKDRKLVASGASQLEGFERALRQGDGALAAAIAAAQPDEDRATAKGCKCATDAL